MRLLVVMPTYPFSPRVGAAIIAYNNVKELSKRHSVYFICFDVAEELKEFAEFAEHFETVQPKFIPVFIQLICYIFYALLRIPFLPATCMKHDMRRRVKELMERDKFDAILLYDLMAIQYCPPCCYKKAIVNVEDPQSIKHKRMRGLPLLSLRQKAELFIRERLAAQFERKYIPKMGKVLLLSQADMLDLEEQGGYDNIGCVTYGVDKRAADEIVGFEGRTEGMVVFSGSMFHPPNIDGAVFFLHHIFPLVLQEEPAAVLWIVGAEPDGRIRDAAERFGEHVVVTGRVNDLSDYLRRARVSICPVRLKIGVQTKILEALSWGTPVVTTSAGNRGIAGRSGSELWVEDDPGKFAGRVVSLLRGEDWHRLSEEGRKLVEERFTWQRSAMELEQHIRSI